MNEGEEAPAVAIKEVDEFALPLMEDVAQRCAQHHLLDELGLPIDKVADAPQVLSVVGLRHHQVSILGASEDVFAGSSQSILGLVAQRYEGKSHSVNSKLA